MEERSQRRAYRQAILAGCVIGLALGGCGDDDPAPSGDGGEGGSVSSAGSGSDGASAGDSSSSAGESTTIGGAAGASQEPFAGGAAGANQGPVAGGAGGGSAAGGGVNVGGGAGNGFYLPCASQADCNAFGGGKVCCAVPGMQFCTKQSACPGNTLP